MPIPATPPGSRDASADSVARRWTARRVVVAVIVGLVLGSLLNAQSLLATAERQPFGWQRDLAVGVAQPLASLSAALWLDRPRALLDQALGRGPAAPIVDPTPDPVEPTVAPTREPTSTPTPEPERTPGPFGLDRGPVTAADPLRLWIAGDSMVEIQFAMALEDVANGTELVEVVGVDFDRGSGLSRPDYIDWPARLAETSRTEDIEVMVIYFGGNDAQPLQIDGVVREPEDPEWQDEYRSRVADLMDQLNDAGHHVFWMGMPIPRSDRMVVRFGILNEIYSSEAATRDGVSFVDVWDLFAGPDGTYAQYLEDDNGEVRQMRLDDGIHFSTWGAYRAARPTLAQILDEAAATPS
jgi:uncharacterized protein